jgi:hypothetical protein
MACKSACGFLESIVIGEYDEDVDAMRENIYYIPIGVVENDDVRCGQIDSKSSALVTRKNIYFSPPGLL